MNLTDALLFLAFVIANMVVGTFAMFRYAKVSSIVARNHPDIWRTFQGFSFAARDAAGRVYGGLAPFRLNDPALSRAVIQAWIATGVWIAVVLIAFATWIVRGG
jgi:hypothetical protein